MLEDFAMNASRFFWCRLILVFLIFTVCSDKRNCPTDLAEKCISRQAYRERTH
jgi:hypothetical protein